MWTCSLSNRRVDFLAVLCRILRPSEISWPCRAVGPTLFGVCAVNRETWLRLRQVSRGVGLAGGGVLRGDLNLSRDGFFRQMRERHSSAA